MQLLHVSNISGVQYLQFFVFQFKFIWIEIIEELGQLQETTC